MELRQTIAKWLVGASMVYGLHSNLQDTPTEGPVDHHTGFEIYKDRSRKNELNRKKQDGLIPPTADGNDNWATSTFSAVGSEIDKTINVFVGFADGFGIVSLASSSISVLDTAPRSVSDTSTPVLRIGQKQCMRTFLEEKLSSGAYPAMHMPCSCSYTPSADFGYYHMRHYSSRNGLCA